MIPRSIFPLHSSDVIAWYILFISRVVMPIFPTAFLNSTRFVSVLPPNSSVMLPIPRVRSITRSLSKIRPSWAKVACFGDRFLRYPFFCYVAPSGSTKLST